MFLGPMLPGNWKLSTLTLILLLQLLHSLVIGLSCSGKKIPQFLLNYSGVISLSTISLQQSPLLIPSILSLRKPKLCLNPLFQVYQNIRTSYKINRIQTTEFFLLLKMRQLELRFLQKLNLLIPASRASSLNISSMECLSLKICSKPTKKSNSTHQMPTINFLTSSRIFIVKYSERMAFYAINVKMGIRSLVTDSVLMTNVLNS